MTDQTVGTVDEPMTAMGAQPEATASVLVDAVVVGAGFGGLYSLYRFREAGMSAIGLEAAPDVGGTWYWNRYPGARCDVPSVFYSYTWSEELRREWRWTELFAAQPEILRYVQYVADRFALRDMIRFETRVQRAAFDAPSDRWEVRTDQGDVIRARFLVMATGNLSVPHAPEIPGIERFTGPAYHTAKWPHDEVSFAGKRVGVIGTGSSGVQIIPLIAEQADEVVVFQRTPNFVFPAQNRPLDNALRDRLEADLPRHRVYVEAGRVGKEAFTAPVPSREEQLDRYADAWKQGANAILMSYPNMLTDERVNAVATEFVHDRIREMVDDPQTAEDLCPTDYPLGVKRICLDTGYYSVFNRDDVTLVNLRREPIETVTEDGITTAERHFPLDVLVYATGFDAMTGAVMAIELIGRDGVSLRQSWADGPHAYLGLAVAGFPNLFMLTAPGSPSVLGNVILNNEQHIDFMMDLVDRAHADGATCIEADAAAEREWVAGVAELASRTLFLKGNSWYLGANIPGKPRVFMPYVGAGYGAHCAQVAADGFTGFNLK